MWPFKHNVGELERKADMRTLERLASVEDELGEQARDALVRLYKQGKHEALEALIRNEDAEGVMVRLNQLLIEGHEQTRARAVADAKDEKQWALCGISTLLGKRDKDMIGRVLAQAKAGSMWALKVLRAARDFARAAWPALWRAAEPMPVQPPPGRALARFLAR